MNIDPFELVSLPRTLKHLREDAGIDLEDLEEKARGALDYCLSYCDNPAFTSVDALPPRFKSAYLLVLSDLWEHRAAQSETNLRDNAAATNLLWSLRSLRDSVRQED